jgi:methionyl-tRNA synthetase
MNNGQKYFKEHPEAVAPVVAIGVWGLIWKAFALYRAGANRSPGWFVALLLLNTVGILEMLYIFVFGKKKRDAPAPAAETSDADS